MRDFVKKKTVDKLQGLKAGEYFDGVVKILRKAKPGPVVFGVSDGYASVDAVTKESSFEVDQVVRLEGMTNERGGRLQIEIDHMAKSDVDFNVIMDKKSEPMRKTFSIKSKRMLPPNRWV